MSPSCPLWWSAATLHTWSLEELKGEGALAWQVWGLYKAPNEGLLARERGGRHSALVWCPCCWSCAYCISNTVSATVMVIAAAVGMVIVARFHWEFGGAESNEGEWRGEKGKNREKMKAKTEKHEGRWGQKARVKLCFMCPLSQCQCLFLQIGTGQWNSASQTHDGHGKISFLRRHPALRSLAKNRPERSALQCVRSLPPVVGSPHCLPPSRWVKDVCGDWALEAFKWCTEVLGSKWSVPSRARVYGTQ